MGSKLLLSLALLGLLFQASLQIDAHKVTSLPDAPDFDFDFYSGYIEIPNSSFKVYYAIETSLNDPENDPVLFWFNGGPGCSSLGGQYTELGYFTQNAEANAWTVNENSWNHFATVVFIESPTGVGFSTSSEADAKIPWSDYSVGQLNYEFAKEFFAAYPDLAKRDFYLTGESYAGIYVPTLAQVIDQHNAQAAEGDFKFNLKGFMVGNGVTDFNVDAEFASVEYLQNHAVLSPTFSERLEASGCELFSISAPYNMNAPTYGIRAKKNQTNSDPSLCYDLEYEFYTVQSGINPYNLLGHCAPDSGMYSPCLGKSFLDEWLQRDDVREALHVSEFTGTWTSCSDPVFETYIRQLPGTIQFYPHLMSQGYKILKYSGDADSVVSFVGTEKWINGLNLEIEDEWRQWFIPSEPSEPAGFIQVYEGLTFATIRNAGHMVPTDKGAQMSHLIKNFITGDEI